VTGREDGAIAIIVAIFAVVLFGFAALVVDLGDAQDVRGQSQHAADAAALAGVRALVANGDVAAAVKSYVASNGGPTDWANCQDAGALATTADTDTSDTCISYDTSQSGDAESYQVRVKLPARTVTASFGGIFGSSSITIAPIAQAGSGLTLPPPCVPCSPALATAPDYQPVDSPTMSSTPSPSTTLTGTPDPVSGCPQPGSYGPGPLMVAGPCALTPGLYVFDGTDVTFAAPLSGSDVTLVFQDGASLVAQSSLAITATSAGTASQAGEIPGLAVFFDDTDTGSFDLGPQFDIEQGDVVGLAATWTVAAGECPGGNPLTTPDSCTIRGGVIAVAHTQFDSGTPAFVGPHTVPSASAPHLTK
jgi:Flp pilus assembly protein TadG